MSRAEELKAIISSSQALLRQGTSARDLLRGRPRPQLTTSLPATSLQPGGGREVEVGVLR